MIAKFVNQDNLTYLSMVVNCLLEASLTVHAAQIHPDVVNEPGKMFKLACFMFELSLNKLLWSKF